MQSSSDLEKGAEDGFRTFWNAEFVSISWNKAIEACPYSQGVHISMAANIYGILELIRSDGEVLMASLRSI